MYSYKFSHIQLTKHALNNSIKTVSLSSPSLASLARFELTLQCTRLSTPLRNRKRIPLQSIRTDDYGLVSFQFMIPLSSNPAKLGLGKKKGGGIGGAGAAAAEEGRVAYVEFLVSVFENQEMLTNLTDFPLPPLTVCRSR